LAGAGVPTKGALLTDAQLDRLADRLYEARCSAEDVITALDEGSGTEDARELAVEVVQLIRSAEQFRG